jgi:hypothetical protein
VAEPAVPVEVPVLFCGLVVSELELLEPDDPLAPEPGVADGLEDEPELPVAEGLDGVELDDDGLELPEVPTVALPLVDLLLGVAGAVADPDEGAVVDDDDERAGGLVPPLLELLSPQAARASTPANALAMRNRLSMSFSSSR